MTISKHCAHPACIEVSAGLIAFALRMEKGRKKRTAEEARAAAEGVG